MMKFDCGNRTDDCDNSSICPCLSFINESSKKYKNIISSEIFNKVTKYEPDDSISLHKLLEKPSIHDDFNFKGCVDYIDLLPKESEKKGDVYLVKYDGNSNEGSNKEVNDEFIYCGNGRYSMMYQSSITNLDILTIEKFLLYTMNHPNDFINYCEIIITIDGKVIICKPCHVEVCLDYAVSVSGRSKEDIKEEINKVDFCLPLEYLVDKYNLIAVWYNGYMHHSQGINLFQQRTIDKLIKNGLLDKAENLFIAEASAYNEYISSHPDEEIKL